MCIGTNVEKFTEGHTQALMKVMVDPATGSDPRCTPL